MPKINIDDLSPIEGTGYPGRLADIVKGRRKRMLGNAAGLSQFGVNLTTLAPGAASAHRHWHKSEDEFVFIVSGELVLIEDDGETVLNAGDAAGFPAGSANGHHLVNRSEADAVYLEVGTRSTADVVTYTDVNVDLKAVKSGGPWRYTRKDGAAY